jgi:tRNA (cmo5U34)-methyltransferase
MASDHIFASDRPIGDFAFDKETARVFEDMLDRSVPGYHEIQRMIAELATDFAIDGTNVYDLGCSTGTTLRNLDSLPQQIRLVGVDSSDAMLLKAEENFKQRPLRHPYALVCSDLNDAVLIESATVVVLSLTLQFVRPLARERILRDIFNSLANNGCLLIIEKVLSEDSLLNRLFIQHYHEFKSRNGYSDLEISRKREALENILIPYRVTENQEMLRNVGFKSVDVFFRWYNFAGIIAIR